MKLTKEILDDLTGRFGCPLYVFDEAGFIQNAKLLDEAMKARYPRYRIAYSYKTILENFSSNPIPNVFVGTYNQRTKTIITAEETMQ